MIDYKHLGESKIRQLQKRRSHKQQIDLEFATAAILIFLGMATLVANW